MVGGLVGVEVGVGVGNTGVSEGDEGSFSSIKAANRLHVTITTESTISVFFILLLPAVNGFYIYCFEFES
jgi:hypothetical protein